MSDDIIKRLREAIAEHPLSPIHGYAEDIAALLDRLDKAERENDGHRQAQASIFRALGKDANPDRATWAETITALAADARRYRWLTDNCGVEMEDGTLGIEFWSDPENWNDLDNAIDAARAAERGKE